MVRGTTPTHTFAIPLPSTSIEQCWITYTQDGEEILNKTKNEITWTTVTAGESCTASFKLTQAQTMLFKTGVPAEIQIAILTSTDAMRSDIITIDVDRILRDMEITST